jgi:hypothetical protein
MQDESFMFSSRIIGTVTSRNCNPDDCQLLAQAAASLLVHSLCTQWAHPSAKQGTYIFILSLINFAYYFTYNLHHCLIIFIITLLFSDIDYTIHFAKYAFNL